MALESAKTLALHAAKATGKAALRALLFASCAVMVNAVLFFVLRAPWTALSSALSWLVLGLAFVAAPVAFGWIGWMQSLTGSAREAVARFAPDVANLVFAKLEERVGPARMEASFDTGVGAKALLDKLGGGGSWMAGLPTALGKLLRLARKVSSPVDIVAQTISSFGGREVGTREVFTRAQTRFTDMLPEAVPQPGWLMLGGAVAVNALVWLGVAFG